MLGKLKLHLDLFLGERSNDYFGSYESLSKEKTPLSAREEALFASVASKNTVMLRELKPSMSDFYLTNENGSLMHGITSSRDQTMMDFFFETVVRPYYQPEDEQGNPLNFTKLDTKEFFTLFDYAVFFNQVAFMQEFKTQIDGTQNEIKASLAFPLLLSFSVMQGYLDMMRLLTEFGANLSPTEVDAPLAFAAITNNTDAATYLIDHGASIDKKDGCFTAIEWAALRGQLDVFMCLLEHGADTTTLGGACADTPLLHLAIQGQNIGLVEKALEIGGADINKVTYSGETALYVAAAYPNIAIFDLLIQHGANLNHPEESNALPVLHAAAYDRQLTMMQHIFTMPLVDVNLANGIGQTALHLMLETDANKENASSKAMIDLLVSHGANVNAVTRDNDFEEGEIMTGHKTPLRYAVEGGDLEAVKTLLQHGADVNVPATDGTTPIFGTNGSLKNEETIFNLLLDEKTDVTIARQMEASVPDFPENRGETVLHLAVANKFTSSVTKLLAMENVTVNATNADGLTPLDLAVESGNEAIKQLLREKGAKTSAELPAPSLAKSPVALFNPQKRNSSEERRDASPKRMKPTSPN